MAVSISIVIPTFRRADRLARLLSATRDQVEQAEGAVEVLVVDNCPDGSARDAVSASPGVRYIQEPVSGVSNARNCGVAASTGTHVLFLDDDEMPEPGWLGAMLRHAEAGVQACFGRVEPRFEAPGPPGLEKILEGMFSRRLDAQPGDDVSARRAWLGTGNSMFKRSVCFPDTAPFDPRFNARGGEDVWFLRDLVMQRGVTLTWAGDAVVTEYVPAERMTANYVRQRKFNSGQLRCLVESAGSRPNAVLRIGGWMGVGLAQASLHGAAWLALSAAGRPEKEAQAARAAAGLGKLLWYQE